MKIVAHIILFVCFGIVCFIQWNSVQFIADDFFTWGGEEHSFVLFFLLYVVFALLIIGINYKIPVNKKYALGFCVLQVLMLIYFIANYVYIMWFNTITYEDKLFNYPNLKEIQPPPNSWMLLSVISSIILIIYFFINYKKRING